MSISQGFPSRFSDMLRRIVQVLLYLHSSEKREERRGFGLQRVGNERKLAFRPALFEMKRLINVWCILIVPGILFQIREPWKERDR